MQFMFNITWYVKDRHKTDPSSDLFGPSVTKVAPGSGAANSKRAVTVRGFADEDDSNVTDLGVGHLLQTEELDFDMFGKSGVRQTGSAGAGPPPAQSHGKGDAGKAAAAATPIKKATKEDFVTGIESSDFLAQLDLAASAPVRYAHTASASAATSDSLFQFDTLSSSLSKPLKDNADAFDINDYINSQETEKPASLFD